MKRGIAILVLGMSVLAWAQSGRGQGQFGGGRPCVVGGARIGDGTQDEPTPKDIDRSGFVYARLRYTPFPWKSFTPEIPWHHDYPDGDETFPTTLSLRTTVHSTPDSYQLVDIDSEEIFRYPFVYMAEPGFLNLLPNDVENLREYLDRGGFMLVDDFRGEEMENLRYQMKKIYPDREIVPLPPTHEIFHVFYDIDSLEMKAPYAGRNSGPVQFLALSDPQGRIQVMVDYNNDISEYWQALDLGRCPIEDAGMAVQLGINYAIYAMSH